MTAMQEKFNPLEQHFYMIKIVLNPGWLCFPCHLAEHLLAPVGEGAGLGHQEEDARGHCPGEPLKTPDEVVCVLA